MWAATVVVVAAAMAAGAQGCTPHNWYRLDEGAGSTAADSVNGCVPTAQQ